MAQLHEYRYTFTGDTEFGGIVYTDAEVRITNFEYFAEDMLALITFKINNTNSSCVDFNIEPGNENVSATVVDEIISQKFDNAVRTYPEIL